MFKTYEEAVQFSKDNVEALVAAGSVVSKGVEDITKAYMGLATTSIEAASEHAKALAACKDPSQAMEIQTTFAKTSVETLIAESKKFAEMGAALAKDASEPLAARYQVATEALSKVAA